MIYGQPSYGRDAICWGCEKIENGAIAIEENIVSFPGKLATIAEEAGKEVTQEDMMAGENPFWDMP